MLILLLSVPVNAAFENIGLLAGPMGMGGAYSAIADNTSALIWNPAGLVLLSAPEIGVSYLELYGLLGYSFVGVAHPIRTGQTVGAAILSSSDTEGLSQERIVLLSAATRAWKQLHLGINAKYFTTSVNLEQVPLGHGTGYGADIGIQYALLNKKISIGIVFPNLFSNVAYLRVEEGHYNESLLREWRIGCAVKLESALAAFEIANGTPLLGCEYQHGDFAFRLGWRFTDGLTAGFGYQYGNIGLDYAFVNGKSVSSQTSLFSVRVFY